MSGQTDTTKRTARHRGYLRRTVIRLLLTYLAPIIVLTVYFHLQSIKVQNDSRKLHLKLMAEHQANTLDLFLRERLVNLTNLIDDPKLEVPPSHTTIEAYLNKLKKNSDTFIDIGFFDSSGVQAAYAGPYASLENRNYSTENWYQSLKQPESNFVITDLYLGFRRKPHFTIGVKRNIGDDYIVMRATLDPEKIYEYITSQEGAGAVNTFIVNEDGFYQVVTSPEDEITQESSIIPPSEPRQGTQKLKTNHHTQLYGYSWLRMADWVLITQLKYDDKPYFLTGIDLTVLFVSLGVISVIFVIIIVRARKLVEFQEESDETKAQLEHVAKLAAVGELAGGIAHEINNPLAIISEEAGLLKDLMNPIYGQKITHEEIQEHLTNIYDAVFRCRDITRKLLGFVRKTDIKLREYNLNELIDNVLDGFLMREMAASNIEIVREYTEDIPRIVTDRNQLEQVLLNIINNAADAIEGAGRITLITGGDENTCSIAVKDTGKGIPADLLHKIFMPFFTTKEVGKGTGLGLSVSYGIVKSLGGKILVESEVGKGSVFTIRLPLK